MQAMNQQALEGVFSPEAAALKVVFERVRSTACRHMP